MKRVLAALLAIAACASSSTAMAADPLGRLFMTPDQRARLEAKRQQKVEISVKESEPQEEETPAASYLTLQGEILRSDGKRTVFINGVPYTESEAPKGARLIAGKRAGEVLVVPSESAAQVRLKVGQSLDKNTLNVDDAAQRAGSIVIGKPASRDKSSATLK